MMPEIRGHQQRAVFNGKTWESSKLQRVLNSFYRWKALHRVSSACIDGKRGIGFDQLALMEQLGLREMRQHFGSWGAKNRILPHLGQLCIKQCY